MHAESQQYCIPNTSIKVIVDFGSDVGSPGIGPTLHGIWTFTDDHIETRGDGELAPDDDPFVYVTSGSQPPDFEFEASSIIGERMTWGVLNIAVNGLIVLVQKPWNRHLNFKFEIWDYEDNLQWGRGSMNLHTAADPLTRPVVVNDQQISSRKSTIIRRRPSD